MRSAARRTSLLLVAVTVTLVIAQPALAADIDGRAADDVITIRGTASTSGEGVLVSGTNSSASTLIRNCVPIDGSDQLRCYTADTAAPDAAGIAAVTVDPAAGQPSAEAIAAVVATELRRLPLRSGGITLQPGTGTTLVNVETIAFTDPTPQTFDITVLGVPVTVVARATAFSWSFEDGADPLVTTDPGAPWPEHTVSHVYRTTGARSITLTTEWTGTFRVAGSDTWQPIDGTAVTVETAPPIEVQEATNRLVAAP